MNEIQEHFNDVANGREAGGASSPAAPVAKTCPFCGSTPYIPTPFQDETSFAGHNIVWHASVSCTNCGVSMGDEADSRDDAVAAAIELWNGRAPEPPERPDRIGDYGIQVGPWGFIKTIGGDYKLVDETEEGRPIATFYNQSTAEEFGNWLARFEAKLVAAKIVAAGGETRPSAPDALTLRVKAEAAALLQEIAPEWQIRAVEKAFAVQPAPCPFCGSTVKMIPNEIARHGSQFGVPNVDVFYAHCYECGADGPVGDSEIEAIRRWNDRRSAPIVPSEDTTAPQCHVDADCVLNAGHRAPCQDAYGGRILPNHRSGGCCDNIPHPLPPTPDGFYALAAAPTLPPDADGDIANVIACIASEIEDAFAAEDAGEPQTPARIRERAEHLAYVMFPPKSASPVLERLDDEAPPDEYERLKAMKDARLTELAPKCDCGAALTQCSDCAVGEWQALHPDCRECCPLPLRAEPKAESPARDQTPPNPTIGAWAARAARINGNQIPRLRACLDKFFFADDERAAFEVVAGLLSDIASEPKLISGAVPSGEQEARACELCGDSSNTFRPLPPKENKPWRCMDTAKCNERLAKALSESRAEADRLRSKADVAEHFRALETARAGDAREAFRAAVAEVERQMALLREHEAEADRLRREFADADDRADRMSALANLLDETLTEVANGWERATPSEQELIALERCVGWAATGSDNPSDDDVALARRALDRIINGPKS